MARRSDPPPSYPPHTPAAPPSARASTPDMYPGWRPADDDVSLQAVDWRARTSLRRSDRALGAIEQVDASVKKLSATVEAWSTRSDKHWHTLARLAWAVGVPVLVAIVLGLGALAYQWISTLHH